MKKMSLLLAAFVVACSVLVLPAFAQTSIAEQQDGRVIENLRNAGSNLSKMHDIDFFLIFQRESDASAASVELRKLGYLIETVARSSDGKQWEVHAKRKMVPALDAMQASTRSLGKVAGTYNGYYDGWGTGSVE